MTRIATVLAGVLICLAPYSLFAGAEQFDTYCNARFGFCVDYPKRLMTGAGPSSGDGGNFYDAGGFSMEVAGINREPHQTVASEMKRVSKSFRKITHRGKGKDWFELSGYKDDKIVYSKVYVGKASVNRLWIEYPEEKKAQYSKTASRVSRSFKPGTINVSR